jgi:hypothetical protein
MKFTWNPQGRRMKNHNESIRVSMKIRMKYHQLHNEICEGKYENQNEIAQGMI